MPTALTSARKARPRVSVLVLTYNQERYVAEALESVLSQEGERLEIVVSDDASSDRTAAVIAGVLAAYRGPHEVVFNRNADNLGFVAHLNAAVARCRGELIVYNAGDDVSRPGRMARLLARFEAESPLVIHGDVLKIDEAGRPTGLWSRKAELDAMSLEDAAVNFALCIGASCAWSRELFDRFGPILFEPTYEDLIFCFRAMMLGRLSYEPGVLLDYRFGTGITTQSTELDPTSRLRRLHGIRRLRLATLRQRERDLEGADAAVRARLRPVIERAIQHCAGRLMAHASRVEPSLIRHPLALSAFISESMRIRRIRRQLA